jgi:FkbM family methyltransferase
LSTIGADSTDESRTAVLVDSAVGPILFPAWDRVMRVGIEQTGAWEPEETVWLAAHASEATLALDIGANVGYHAITIARAVGPTGRVIALEPDPFNYELLLANLRINAVHNVCALNVAAGDRNGMVEFTRDPVNAGDHRTYRRQGSDAGSVIRVPMIRIDDLRIQHRVGLALTDTQSFDHRVIRGMHRLIERDHPPMLVEFWTEGMAELADDPAEAITYYRSLGYDVTVLDDPSIEAGSPPGAYIAAAEGPKVAMSRWC